MEYIVEILTEGFKNFGGEVIAIALFGLFFWAFPNLRKLFKRIKNYDDVENNSHELQHLEELLRIEIRKQLEEQQRENKILNEQGTQQYYEKEEVQKSEETQKRIDELQEQIKAEKEARKEAAKKDFSLRGGLVYALGETAVFVAPLGILQLLGITLSVVNFYTIAIAFLTFFCFYFSLFLRAYIGEKNTVVDFAINLALSIIIVCILFTTLGILQLFGIIGSTFVNNYAVIIVFIISLYLCYKNKISDDFGI